MSFVLLHFIREILYFLKKNQKLDGEKRTLTTLKNPKSTLKYLKQPSLWYIIRIGGRQL